MTQYRQFTGPCHCVCVTCRSHSKRCCQDPLDSRPCRSCGWRSCDCPPRKTLLKRIKTWLGTPA